MQLVTTIAEARLIRWQEPARTWGFVPTMGALHAGHLSLVRHAVEQNERVAVSIFVNPTQFNQASDLENYPRQLERDVELLKAEGVHLVWAPSQEEMYPATFQTYVEVESLAQGLEGAARPGHFRGVATVVAKLFNVIQPARAYVGQKDAQQAAVIRQMVRDLAFNLEVVVAPTMRERDGLAMSSRNVRLNPSERAAATVLYRALTAADRRWQTGERDAEALRETMRQVIEAEPLARVDYVSVADPLTLTELHGEAASALFSLAVFIGDTRLIDNLIAG